MARFTIGRLAKMAHVGVETVRFYETKGLIPRPPKRVRGFREYSEKDVRRIQFIKKAQHLGFTLKEIRELLQLRVRSSATCGEVKRRAKSKIVEIGSKMDTLRKMRNALVKLARECGGGMKPSKECPILDCLEEE